MILDPFFLLVAVPAVLIIGIAKGGFGAGFGIIGVPLMALAITPPQAAAILLPILCVMDIFTLLAWRGRWDRKNALILISGSVIGVVIGAALFRHLNVDALRLFIGIIALVFCAYHLALGRLLKGEAKGPNVAKGAFWGAVSGLTSFSAHAGGPPVTIYLLPQKLDKSVYQATTVIVFVAINYMKLVPYWWLGQFSTQNLSTSLLLLPLAPLGIWLGVWLHKRVDQKLFYRVVIAALLLTGGKLFWDGLQGLI